ncbi:MAG: DUF2474 domain-containing protein [Pseudomonadota bacterium]|nr:DUF2474 domain-containing protein [Pseudomonadota bacterium]
MRTAILYCQRLAWLGAIWGAGVAAVWALNLIIGLWLKE